CITWSRASPSVARLAYETARVALADGAAASGRLPTAPVELGISLIDAAEQQQLNREYRGHGVPTNVLAFPAWEAGTPGASDAPVLLGDVVLAYETVASEATA